MLTVWLSTRRDLARRAVLPGVLAFCVGCVGSGPQDTASLVAELDAELPRVVARGNSPSTQIAVVHRDRVVWSRAFGEDAGVDRVYMNASVQKVFTAVAVLQLVEAGLVDLDSDVSGYLPFAVRHPGFSETPITVRMLLTHRSGLDMVPHQFARDTESTFSPRFRPPCPDDLADISLEEFLAASLVPGGSNYDPQVWVHKPDHAYHYSVSAYLLLRFLIGRVAGQSYAEYVHENLFVPLGMTSSGFSADEFAGRHAIPYTRIDDQNIELPLWNGRDSMMHTTADDLARFMLALMHDGRHDKGRILPPETIALMRQRTARFKTLFKGGHDLPTAGHGLTLSLLRGGWLGIGGSVPGYQCLWRFHPSRQVGYVIMSNVNAILGGGQNYASARGEIYAVQDALVAILDPTFVIRRRAGELWLAGALFLYVFLVVLWGRRRRARRR